MITIPTYELIGMLSDVLPFVSPDKDDLRHHCVRIASRDETLSMLATNRLQAVRTTWTEDDVDTDADSEEATFAFYGPERDHVRFDVRVSVPDAKALTTAFKLTPGKLGWAPVTIQVISDPLTVNLYSVIVARKAVEGLWPALTVRVSGIGAPVTENGDSPELDIEMLIDAISGVQGVAQRFAISPKALAALGKVDRHGPLEVYFPSGGTDGAMIFFRMGTRFTGIAHQPRVEK